VIDSVDATATSRTGRHLAWTALVVALGASVAANVASAQPHWGPRLSASVAPVLVVIAAALLESVSLRIARRWQRLLYAGALSLIVAGAFVTSYEHQRSLLIAYGNAALSATLLPLSIDALIIMASVSLSVAADQRRADAVAPPVAPVAPAPVAPPAPWKPATVNGTPARAPQQQPRRPRTGASEADFRNGFYADPRVPAPVLAERLGVSRKTVERRYAELREAGAPTGAPS
jgi:Protein of unknown function (DUF2637)/Winged helix-turn-helix DNA-binding